MKKVRVARDSENTRGCKSSLKIERMRTISLGEEQFEIRPLRNRHEIRAASELLYRVYIAEGQWDPPSKDAAGVEVRKGAHSPYLWDNFSGKAHWVGCFRKAEVVGCARALKYPDLELGAYGFLPETFNQRRAVEFNRLAVDTRYRMRGELALQILRVLCDNYWPPGSLIYATAEVPGRARFFKALGLQPSKLPKFKYSELDPNPVELLYIDSIVFPREGTSLYRMSENWASESLRQ